MGGGQAVLIAAFIIGCDGAHSTVRHLLALPFDGAEYEDSFMPADVETNDALPATELQLSIAAVRSARALLERQTIAGVAAGVA
jgi:2-polyprenyl-6-methoxyphenol hydroxylase-like FAD-dependent oxidoreductase